MTGWLWPPKDNRQAANRGESLCSLEGYLLFLGGRSSEHHGGWSRQEFQPPSPSGVGVGGGTGLRPQRGGGEEARSWWHRLPTGQRRGAGSVVPARPVGARWRRDEACWQLPVGWGRGSSRRPGHRSSRCSNGMQRPQRSSRCSAADVGGGGGGAPAGCAGPPRPHSWDRSPPSTPHPAGGRSLGIQGLHVVEPVHLGPAVAPRWEPGPGAP